MLFRSTAHEQLALARGCLAWAGAHGIDTSDLAPRLETAAARLSDPANLGPFYEDVDALWIGLHGRLPAPKSGAASVSAPAAADVEEA